MEGGLIVTLFLAFIVVIILLKTAVVVPQQSAYVVERLGKYSSTLDAGFHILVPFVDAIRYRHSLKETAMDIPEQVYHARQRPGARGRHSVPARVEPGAGLLRDQRFPIRVDAIGADGLAE